MASQFNDSFNGAADKVVNLAELTQRFKEELDAPFKGLGLIKKPAVRAFEMVAGFAKVPKTIASSIKQATNGIKPANDTYYINKDKVATFDEVKADRKNAINNPGLPKFSTLTGAQIFKTVGQENMYQNAQEALAAYSALVKPSRRILAAYQTALEKSTDYSEQVKTGQLIKRSII